MTQLVGTHYTAAVVAAWRALAAHGTACESCGQVAAELAQVPEDPFPLYDRCCPAGQHLFIGWADAKILLIGRARELTAPWGMAGRVGVSAEDRAAAITALPAAGAQDIFATVDAERREAKIAAVIAGYRGRWTGPAPPARAGRPAHLVPGGARARPHLVDTED